MEDVLSMIVLMIIYIVAAAVGGKKKKARKQTSQGNPAGNKRMRTAGADPRLRRPAGRDERQPSRDAIDALEDVLTAFEADCRERPVHLHDVPQSVMNAAGEGEDPCHAGGMNTEETAKEFEATQIGNEGETLMQDMLRGVIMSEILTRPCDRRAAGRNRRSYHG